MSLPSLDLRLVRAISNADAVWLIDWAKECKHPIFGQWVIDLMASDLESRVNEGCEPGMVVLPELQSVEMITEFMQGAIVVAGPPSQTAAIRELFSKVLILAIAAACSKLVNLEQAEAEQRMRAINAEIAFLELRVKTTQAEITELEKHEQS